MEARTEERELERAPAGAPEAAPDGHPQHSRAYQLLTIAGLLTLAALTLIFELDIGFVAITIGLVLTLISPQLQKRAVGQVTWPEILLITGVGTYVGDSVTDLASPLLVALLLCLIAAMAVSSAIVDVSPFSTNGALVLANAPESVDRHHFFRQLVAYGALVTLIAPVVLWFVFVVLMDIRMAHMDGLTATELLRSRRDPPEVIVLTTFDSDDHVLRALRAGASGFLLKHTPPPEIARAIRLVASGEPMLSPTVLRRIMSQVAGVGADRLRDRGSAGRSCKCPPPGSGCTCRWPP